MRIHMLQVLAIVAATIWPIQPTLGQQYPSKVVRLIIPFAPGGGVDLLARGISQELAKGWKQSVIVENRPGGNSIIGADACAKSVPDGHTLCMLSATTQMLPYIYSKLPFDPAKDLEPVTTLVLFTSVLVANPAVRATSVKEVIALAREKPGTLNFSTLGTATFDYMFFEWFKREFGLDIVHVPYQGQGPALVQAILAGDVQLARYGLLNMVGHIRTGKLKGLAVSGPARSPLVPEIPTFAEAGLGGIRERDWYGLFVPARTPPDIVDRVQREIARVFAIPEFREKYLTSQALTPVVDTPAEFAEFLKADRRSAEALAKLVGVRLD